MTRWTTALAASLLLHAGAAVGTLGRPIRSPSFEVTAGEARVTLALRPKPAPRKSTLSIDPIPPKKTSDSPAAVPEIEGAESSAPQSPRNPPPPYPAEAFRRGIQGTTSLLVRVSAQGAASQVTVERSSGSAILDEAAAGAVAKWTFLPARRLGVPVSGAIRIRIRFQIVQSEDSR